MAAQQAQIEIERKLKPVVITIMNAKGATMVLDKGFVYHNAAGLDVTTEVIEALDSSMPGFQVSIPATQ